jgi:hypothetical protein
MEGAFSQCRDSQAEVRLALGQLPLWEPWMECRQFVIPSLFSAILFTTINTPIWNFSFDAIQRSLTNANLPAHNHGMVISTTSTAVKVSIAFGNFVSVSAAYKLFTGAYYPFRENEPEPARDTERVPFHLF